MLKYIIPSKTRRKILSLFYQNPQKSLHLRKVGREVGEEINAVKRELDILEKAKVLRKEKRLNKSIYTINTSYVYYDEFMRIFIKEGNMATTIRSNLSKLGEIKLVVVSYHFAQRKKIAENEIYLLLVGVIVGPEIAKIVKEEEKTYPFEINYTVMTKEEFAYRKKNNDPFIWTFLKKPKIMFVGKESDLMA